MNIYVFCTVAIKIIAILAILGVISFAVAFVSAVIDDFRAERIGCVSGIVALCCFIVSAGLLIAYAINVSKCQTIIEAKLGTKYEDYAILADDNNSQVDVLSDKFEFISNNTRYEAYYNENQDAVIINKINTKETDKISNIFGRTVNRTVN